MINDKPLTLPELMERQEAVLRPYFKSIIIRCVWQEELNHLFLVLPIIMSILIGMIPRHMRWR